MLLAESLSAAVLGIPEGYLVKQPVAPAAQSKTTQLAHKLALSPPERVTAEAGISSSTTGSIASSATSAGVSEQVLNLEFDSS
jgi:hypothetical protein